MLPRGENERSHTGMLRGLSKKFPEPMNAIYFGNDGSTGLQNESCITSIPATFDDLRKSSS
jgi:hypothetical protein